MKLLLFFIDMLNCTLWIADNLTVAQHSSAFSAFSGHVDLWGRSVGVG